MRRAAGTGASCLTRTNSTEGPRNYAAARRRTAVHLFGHVNLGTRRCFHVAPGGPTRHDSNASIWMRDSESVAQTSTLIRVGYRALNDIVRTFSVRRESAPSDFEQLPPEEIERVAYAPVSLTALGSWGRKRNDSTGSASLIAGIGLSRVSANAIDSGLRVSVEEAGTGSRRGAFPPTQ